MPKLYVETYGCTANKSDESLVLGVLKKTGYELVCNVEEADVVVVLTCVVIDTTEQRMLHRLKMLKDLDKKIVVSGCLASVGKEKIKDIVPNALIIHPRMLARIDEILLGQDTSDEEKAGKNKVFPSVSAPIAIAEGCRFSCSYCITCLARGKLRSFSKESIISDVQSAVSSGCREILLTAQDTASFGVDSDDSLETLIKQICQVKGEFMIRVGMMNPRSLLAQSESVFDAFDHQKVYNFLHLPVQSGDDEILSAMRRGYCVDDFVRLVESFRLRFPDAMLSTDIIVGFPNESDDQFEASVELIKKVNPDIVNITRFSARQNTHAKTLQGRVPTSIVKERSKRLTKVCQEEMAKRAQHYVNKRYSMAVLKQNEYGYWGRIQNYKLVFLKEKNIDSSFVEVEIVDTAPTFLYGRLI